MEELKRYLNSLSKPDQVAYAKACLTTLGYLRKAVYSESKPTFDAALARLLDENSGGVVKKHALRPDVWPELVDAA